MANSPPQLMIRSGLAVHLEMHVPRLSPLLCIVKTFALNVLPSAPFVAVKLHLAIRPPISTRPRLRLPAWASACITRGGGVEEREKKMWRVLSEQ